MRSTRIAALILIWTLSLVSLASAQHVPNFMRDTVSWGELLKFEKRHDDPLQKKCGEYFRYESLMDDNVDLIHFILMKQTRNSVVHQFPRPVPLDRIELVMVKGLSAPMARVVRFINSDVSWYRIEISESDYGRAPCLRRLKVATK